MAMDNEQVLRGIKVLAKAVVVMGVATFFGEQANRVQKMAQGKTVGQAHFRQRPSGSY